ncbi:MAG TPA: hypothetical protein VG323_04620 [Thermoanaerobaculia bacterium]|nr:hypothetical protein [Thermoanaerobaculia bacterium]
MATSNTPDESLPADFEESAKRRFDALSIREVSFEAFLEGEKAELLRQRDLDARVVAIYKPAIGTITPCGNGDLDKLLDPAEWQGAYGTRPLPGIFCMPVNFTNLSAGLLAGSILSSSAHHTWVPSAFDSNVGIPTTAQGSAGAVRIGNQAAGYGCELLSKTFIVTPAQRRIVFRYAVVLQDGGHVPTACQAFFQVRVTDASGAIVPGAFDFGGGSDTLFADAANPAFLKQGPDLLYTDWRCAHIDLSSKVGQQVTVELVTSDCGYGGHFGYAYIDTFCGRCTCEEIEREQDESLRRECAKKVNLLARIDCESPEPKPQEPSDCRCDCRMAQFPDIQPCISVSWGDSKCDCLETDDVEVLCIKVCNCYSNVTFGDFTIGHIEVTDLAGHPVPTLPDGTPSVRVIPSGPICFGDIGPCKPPNQPSCVSRELVLYTRGAVGKDYKLSFSGLCFSVRHDYQSEQCFLLPLCQD